MKKALAILFLAASVAAFAAKKAPPLSGPIASDIRDSNMVEYVLDGDAFRPKGVDATVRAPGRLPSLKALAPSNASVRVVAIYANLVNVAETNINGTAYVASDVYWTCNWDATGYHPFLRYTYVGSPTYPVWQRAIQDEAVNIGNGEVGGVEYEYLWYGRCWIEKGVSPYIQVYIDDTDYDGPEGKTAQYDIAVPAATPGRKWQYVMVDENGNVAPSNVLYTIAQAVTTENELIVASEAAIVQSNTYASASKVVADLTAAIVDNAITIYQDDYVYSLGETVSVSTNARCRIYRFDAKQGIYNIDGIDYDASDVYYGFTEDIGSLTPEAKFKDSLGGDTIDWETILADPSVPQSHTFEHGGDVYAYCYKMRIYIPHSYNAAFIKVFTEITAQQGDGSVIDIVNGVRDGFTGTVTYGETTINFVGGLAIAPGH